MAQVNQAETDGGIQVVAALQGAPEGVVDSTTQIREELARALGPAVAGRDAMWALEQIKLGGAAVAETAAVVLFSTESDLVPTGYGDVKKARTLKDKIGLVSGEAEMCNVVLGKLAPHRLERSAKTGGYFTVPVVRGEYDNADEAAIAAAGHINGLRLGGKTFCVAAGPPITPEVGGQYFIVTSTVDTVADIVTVLLNAEAEHVNVVEDPRFMYAEHQGVDDDKYRYRYVLFSHADPLAIKKGESKWITVEDGVWNMEYVSGGVTKTGQVADYAVDMPAGHFFMYGFPTAEAREPEAAEAQMAAKVVGLTAQQLSIKGAPETQLAEAVKVFYPRSAWSAGGQLTAQRIEAFALVSRGGEALPCGDSKLYVARSAARLRAVVGQYVSGAVEEMARKEDDRKNRMLKAEVAEEVKQVGGLVEKWTLKEASHRQELEMKLVEAKAAHEKALALGQQEAASQLEELRAKLEAELQKTREELSKAQETRKAEVDGLHDDLRCTVEDVAEQAERDRSATAQMLRGAVASTLVTARSVHAIAMQLGEDMQLPVAGVYPRLGIADEEQREMQELMGTVKVVSEAAARRVRDTEGAHEARARKEAAAAAAAMAGVPGWSAEEAAAAARAPGVAVAEVVVAPAGEAAGGVPVAPDGNLDELDENDEAAEAEMEQAAETPGPAATTLAPAVGSVAWAAEREARRAEAQKALAVEAAELAAAKEKAMTLVETTYTEVDAGNGKKQKATLAGAGAMDETGAAAEGDKKAASDAAAALLRASGAATSQAAAHAAELDQAASVAAAVNDAAAGVEGDRLGSTREYGVMIPGGWWRAEGMEGRKVAWAARQLGREWAGWRGARLRK